MKKLFITIIIVFVSILSIQAQEKIKIAVMDFAVGDGVHEAMTNGLSDALINSLSETGKFTIVECEQLYQAIEEQKFEQSDLSPEQIAEAGKIINVESVLTGIVNYSTTSNKYSFNIIIIDVESGKITYTTVVNQDKSKTINQIFHNLKSELAEQLIWKFVTPIDLNLQELQDLEEMPSFPGGEDAINKYLAKTIKYPVKAAEANIQGRVVCQFVINEDGSIVNIEVIRGADPILNKEAIRVIKNMPKWNPGMKDGKPVNVRYTFPINFRVQSNTRFHIEIEFEIEDMTKSKVVL